MVTNKLRCPVQGCGYEATGRGMGGHISGHKMRGDIPKDAKVKGIVIHKAQPAPLPTPQQEVVTPASVADSLLEQVVNAINASEALKQQLKVSKTKIVELEASLVKAYDEKDRILKIHNEQAKRKEFTTSDELVRLARQPKSRD